jgi:hypothetical protein
VVVVVGPPPQHPPPPVVVDVDEVEDEEEIDEVEDEVPGGLGGIHMTAPRAKVHMSVTTTAAAGIDIPALFLT